MRLPELPKKITLPNYRSDEAEISTHLQFADRTRSSAIPQEALFISSFARSVASVTRSLHFSGAGRREPSGLQCCSGISGGLFFGLCRPSGRFAFCLLSFG
jgi:hypothetical protein